MAPDNDGRWRLTVGDDVVFDVDPTLGGRVTRFALDGHNVLAGPDANADNFGSTFWTSPQTAWGWPPPVEIDRAPYAARRDGDALVLTGPVSPALGVAVEKRFVVDAGRAAIVATYALHNHGAAVVSLAPWEITRVPPGGLTFFPTGEGSYPPSNLEVVDAGGVTFFPYDSARISGHPKLFADAGGGWLAHVDVARRLLLLKTFPTVPRARQAPGEALIELYAHPDHTYVELEQQGAYEPLAAGEVRCWTVGWQLRRLPAEVAVAVGSPSLLAFVRALVAGRE